MRNSLKLAAMLVAVTAASASAQTGRKNHDVPPGQRPPDGMCRVWVDGVAPGRQSAVTDCATAEAQARVTAHSRVIYGGFPGKKGSHNDNDDILTRRRQLADGTWVIDRYRRDANGNITIVSTKPLSSADKAHRKAVKKQLKAERKADKREDELEDRADKRRDKIEGRAENRRDDDLMSRGKSAGKGKGKK
jgi:hypothetical protein